VPNLTYATMILEESMRLYPPAYAIARYGNEPDEVETLHCNVSTPPPRNKKFMTP
jgi:cytochrome P450